MRVIQFRLPKKLCVCLLPVGSRKIGEDEVVPTPKLLDRLITGERAQPDFILRTRFPVASPPLTYWRQSARGRLRKAPADAH